jgi:hypothetical protein
VRLRNVNNNVVLYDIIMQTKEVIKSILKVSSLIIVLNGFELWQESSCYISRGRKVRKVKIPYTSGK